jgi:hypothetical protein
LNFDLFLAETPNNVENDGKRLFGPDSVFLSKTPTETNWGGNNPRFKRQLFTNNKRGTIILKNRNVLEENGVSYYEFQTCSFNSIFHCFQTLCKTDELLNNTFKESASLFGNLLAKKDPDDKEIYRYRMATFKHLKKFSDSQVNRDCNFSIEPMYKFLFKEVFSEYNICSRCNEKVEISNLINVSAESLSDLQKNLSEHRFMCLCGNPISKYFRHIITVSIINISLSNPGFESYFDIKVNKIPTEIEIFNEQYIIKSLLCIIQTNDINCNHYVSLSYDSHKNCWIQHDCLTQKLSIVPKTKRIRIVMIIAIKRGL